MPGHDQGLWCCSTHGCWRCDACPWALIETGTGWVRRLTRQNPSTVIYIYIAHITTVEFTCAIARRRKGRMLTAAKASSLLRRFRQHLAGRYVIVEVTPGLLDEATRLGNTHALRAYDVVQLAVVGSPPAKPPSSLSDPLHLTQLINTRW
jgi:predicted nucleic acid-binding protein